ncbi:uncharacterized protein ISCGN_023364 [Ixodes scapularis]
MGGTTATAMDGIPMRLVNELGPETRALQRVILNQILKEGWAPVEWRTPRLRLIYKGKGQKSTLGNYRPIAITSVLYRVFTEIIRYRLQTWAVAEGVLGELQSGLRDRAEIERRPLYLCFLDISRAYDSGDHEKLWRQLAKRGLGGEWINQLKQIYKETTVVAQWQEEMTHPVAITKGLRQGCPLSPLLFMLYTAGFDNRLQNCAEGFTLENTEAGTNSLEGLQALMNECNTMGTALGLSFSAKKSALMGFGDRGYTKADYLKIQGEQVPWVSQYKYLGIHIQEGHNYLEDHETRLQAKSRRSKGISTARALWGYNRFEISRAVCKMVAVPGLTFGNGVLCLSSRMRECLEVRQ